LHPPPLPLLGRQCCLNALSAKIGSMLKHMFAIQVWFLPSFSDQQRSALLAACTALLYTPTNEHFGIVPLEAMACGRPVVACDSGGPRETIVSGKTGFLSEPTPHSFATAMRRLLVHPPPPPHTWLGHGLQPLQGIFQLVAKLLQAGLPEVVMIQGHKTGLQGNSRLLGHEAATHRVDLEMRASIVRQWWLL